MLEAKINSNVSSIASFDRLTKYNTKIVLRNFNARVGREESFRKLLSNQIFIKSATKMVED